MINSVYILKLVNWKPEYTSIKKALQGQSINIKVKAIINQLLLKAILVSTDMAFILSSLLSLMAKEWRAKI